MKVIINIKRLYLKGVLNLRYNLDALKDKLEKLKKLILKSFYKLEKIKKLILKSFYKLQILENETNLKPNQIKNVTRRNNRKIKKILFTFNIILFLIPYTFFSYNVYRPRYLTTSKIVIRNSSNNTTGDNTILSLLGTNSPVSFNEAKFIKTFLHSPQVFYEIEEKFSFSKLYSKKGLDFISGIYKNTPLSKKLEFYRNNIILNLDYISGELEIKVVSFQANTSYEINKFLISKAEQFINDLNSNISKSQLEFQNEEVFKAFNKIKNKQREVTNFQNKNLLFDGYDALRANTNIINGLENELVKLKFELSTIKRKFIDQKAPEIVSLKNQITELEKQINIEKNQIFSDSGKRLNKKAFDLKTLQSDLEFNRDLYKSALTIQESARIGTIKQNRFIIKLIEPYIAQREYLYPKNKFYFSSVILIFLTYYLTKFIFGIVDNYKI